MNAKKVLQRNLSAILTLVLVLGLLALTPVLGAQASTSGTRFYNPNGAGGTTDYQQVYYGRNDSLWRVLDTRNGEIFLLREESVENRAMGNSAYMSSALRTHLSGTYFNNSFNTKERNAILAQDVSTEVSVSDVDGDKIFLLSQGEANNPDYFPYNDTDRKINTTWWLRTNGGSSWVQVVVNTGIFSSLHVSSSATIRPAIKLNPTQILFSSATVDGKSAATVGSGFQVLSPDMNDTIKLTMLDESQALTATMTGTVSLDEAPLTIASYNYSFDSLSTNSYLSAVLDDGLGNTYYSKLRALNMVSGNGNNLDIDITGIPLGTYTLKLFTEIETVDTESDYASTMVEIPNVRIQNSIPVTGVSLNKSTLSLETSKEETLTATIVPNSATYKNLTWASNNSTVATVDSNGKVKAIKAGTATITVTTTNGLTATCLVTVTQPSVPVTPTPPPRPIAAPVGVSAIPSRKAVELSWNKVDGATSYEILRSNNKNSGFRSIRTLDQNATSFRNTSLSEGKTYYYKVRAKDNSTFKDSSVVTVKTIAKTTALKLKKNGNRLRVSYKSTEKNFQVQISRKKNSGYRTLISNNRKKSYTATNKNIRKALKLKTGRSYTLYVRVRSYRVVNNKRINGSWSKTRTVKNFRIR